MSKIKNENQHGSFIIEKTGYKKIVRNFVAALTAVIFILGTGTVIFNKVHKPKKVSQSETNSISSDTPGWWLQQYFGSSTCDTDICKPDADPDQDKLNNAQEYYYHSNPQVAFTMNDTLNDGELVAAGFDPSRPNRMTFDQAASPDNILGESLLLDADVKKIVAESNDISKVNLPLVADDQLKLINNPTRADYQKYLNDTKAVIDKYFNEDSTSSTVSLLETPNSDVSGIIVKAQRVSEGLKAVSVPAPVVLFHKYNIAMYQLMAEVINPADQTSDAWYEKAQAFMAVDQKLNFETQRLTKLIQL